MTKPVSVCARPSDAGVLGLAALLLAGLGVAAATGIIVGSDGDTEHVRWWLVVAPIAIVLVPVLVPIRAARIGAMLALGAWCVLGALSIGFLLLPALAALVGAVLREER